MATATPKRGEVWLVDLGMAAKKSEVLRAALAVLARLSDAEVAAAIKGLAVIKTGRPAKNAK